MSKLNIIIPAYKATKTINRALASIYMQTIKDELRVTIVSDSDGIDYSDNMFKDDLNITYLSTDKNMGAGGARQLGLDNSEDMYIMFMDADDALSSAFSSVCCNMKFPNVSNNSLKYALNRKYSLM